MSRTTLTGQTLGGRYRIDEILGQGGMSAVYKAYDPNLKRVVAVKVIHAHLAGDPKFLMRFEEEAAAVAQLRHPNIIQVFDFNHDEDLYYMVQEFVAGETLQEHLRRLNQAGKHMPVAEAIQVTVDICDAAGYAHRRGMIHRDIKPANIMLDVHGKAILMDFGIVKITGAEKHTATGAVVGTALYMPPEMIRGESPDPRSDLYSLGVTLFEMVSGRPPFEADSAMTLMMMHLREPVPDVRGLRPEIPEDLIAVITKAMSKEQNDRYGSMDELAAVLKAVSSGLQSGAPSKATLIETQSEILGKVVQGPESTWIEEKPALPEPAAGGAGKPPEFQAKPAPSSASLPANPPAASPENGRNASVASTAIPATAGRRANRNTRYALSIGGAVVLLLLILGGIWLATRKPGNGTPTNQPLSALPSATSLAVVAPAATETASLTPSATVASLPAALPTAAPTSTPAVTATPTTLPTVTPTPTFLPTPTLSPTPTIPPGVPFVRIDGIGLDINGNYVVDYETFEYTPKIPGTHIHFFFNTVPPDQAGKPTGAGLWMVYGGTVPFTGLKQTDRPKNATQLCALVANSDHSVQPNSGNCFPLPDVVLATPLVDTPCLLGPDPAFAVFTPLFAGQSVLVRGISPDEQWWNVASPENMDNSCWLAKDAATVSGDISSLGLIEPPPLPTGSTPSNFSVEITQITIDAQNHYVVAYVTHGFTPALPGTHLHFFFNTVSPDQVGMTGGGNRLMTGGPAPFTGYSTTDRPPDATQLCVLVANPDHSVILNSGNCLQLPDVPGP